MYELTEEQIKAEIEYGNKLRQIETLKANLANTDYQAIKHGEGEITNEEYEPIRNQRREWRREINELERGIDNGN